MRRQQDNTKISATIARPLARSDELVVEQLAEEVLIYDQRTDQAHCLSPAAATVWRACDGTRSGEELGAELGLDAATVGRALEELEACGLLDTGTKAGVTRREATTRLARLGAVGAAAPLIWSIAGPISEAAATVTPAFCTNSGVSQDCGVPCMDRHCCCCCQSITSPPSVCTGTATSKCCLPSATCASMFGGHCSDTAPCP
jgi:hypothetical protein